VKFSHPEWLPAGVVVCLCLLWLWRRYDARQHAALARFVATHLRAQLTQSVSSARRRAQRLLLLTSVALLFVALAGPLVGYRWEQISRRGNEIIFAVDTSRSMSTPDVKPDRLTRAKLAIDDFTHALDGDAVGLVAFAGNAFLVCPITLDYGAFHESLSAIDTNTIPRGGTNIASAIREAQAALRRRPGSDKILILVTDGEDLEGDALVAAQAAARQDGLKIFTIGVGTPQGDLVPLSAEQRGGFVKDAAGAFVRSRLDEPALKAIAAATGGLYAPLGAQGQGFDYLYKSALGPMLKHDLASRQQRVYTQRYQWPLSASVGLLLGSLLIGTRRRSRAAPRRLSATRSRSQSQSLEAASLSWLILPLLLLGFVAPVRASPASAEEAYKKGDFDTAAKEFAAAAERDPKKPVLAFNAGTAAYKAGQYRQAAKAFQQSISRAPAGDAGRLADQEDAYYNLGNTLYRTGQATEQSAPEQSIETWTSALKAYDTALQMRADDADSKFNRDFVKRRIDELKRKQNPPQNQPNSQQNQNQHQQQNQNQQQQSSQNSGQPPQTGTPPNAGQPPPASQQPPASQSPPSQSPPSQQPQSQQPPQQQAQQPPPAQPPPGAGQPKSGDGQPKPAPGAEDPEQADAQPAPGQMSQEEARELLDAQKGDERRAQGLPFARRESASPPDKPVKDW
jgi:Ca-activated chloride channel family protein